MYKSQLIETLKTLDKKELKQFDLFLISPFFNRTKQGIALWEYFDALDFNWESPELFKIKVAEALFLNKKASEQQLRLEMSNLFQLLKSFLAQLTYQEIPGQSKIYALDQLRKRNVDRVFRITMKQTVEQFQAMPFKDKNYYHLSFQVAAVANGHYGQRGIREFDPHLQQKVDNLDIYYFSLKLQESCEMLNRNHILHQDYQIHLIDEMRALLRVLPQPLAGIPVIEIYNQVFWMLSEEDSTSYYQKLISLLAAYHDQFPTGEARAMYKYAQNYCIRKINQGDTDYLKELFGIYRACLDNGLLFVNKELAHTDYKNIIVLGLRLQNYDWVYDFMESHKDRVSTHHRENVYQISKANYLVETDQAEKAIILLQTVQFTDVYYQTGARHLLLKVYYDTEDLDGASYHLDAFMIFLKRNKKISKENKKSQLTYLKFVRKMIRLKENEGVLMPSKFETEAKVLFEKVKDTPDVFQRKWLLERITKMIN